MLPEIEVIFASLHTTSSQRTSRHLIMSTSTTHSISTQHGTYSILSRVSEEMGLGMLPDIEVLYTQLHTTSSQCTHNT